MQSFKNFVLRKPVREKVKLSFVDLQIKRDSPQQAKQAVDRFLEPRPACETDIRLMIRMHRCWVQWCESLMLEAMRGILIKLPAVVLTSIWADPPMSHLIPLLSA